MSFYPKTHYDVQIVGLGNNNFREINNGYYGYRINTADQQHIVPNAWLARGRRML